MSPPLPSPADALVRRILFFVACLLSPLTVSAQTTVPSNPLAPALSGQAECYSPNDIKKTCQSLAYYTKTKGPEYINTAIILVAGSPLVTLETKTPVLIKSGKVCGAIRYDDVVKGKLVIGGRTVSAKEAAPMLESLALNMSLMMNKELCTGYDVTPKGRIAKTYVNGTYSPGGDQIAKWVRPSDGYRVAP